MAGFDPQWLDLSWYRLSRLGDRQPPVRMASLAGRAVAADPIHMIGPYCAGEFVAALDDQTRAARFLRAMTPEMERRHYRELDPDASILVVWMESAVICGLAETILHRRPRGIEAELGLCVAPAWRGRGIEVPLLARADEEAAARGATICRILLGEPNSAEAEAVRRLGGIIDWEQHAGIFRHRQQSEAALTRTGGG